LILTVLLVMHQQKQITMMIRDLKIPSKVS